MSSESQGPLAIRASSLGKRYRIGIRRQRYQTLRDQLAGVASAPFRRLAQRTQPSRDDVSTMWALRDVSFTVERGEVVGIIGRNGAGKTTLLKILSRITEPTEGMAEIHGRVGSLLEVGTGFHPELTGRDNIFLNGAILGMRRQEIRSKFDQIVTFAEVERFIDTPVKHYSSGMQMRLAFSVAAHLEPEILIIDEVLTVGDAAFQKKCLGKIGDVTHEGRTVLFVSHNMPAVDRLCDRVIWLETGRVRRDGEAHEVVSDYLASTLPADRGAAWANAAAAPGNEALRLHRVGVGTPAGTDAITPETPIDIEVEYWNLRPGVRLNLSLVLYNQEGVCVLSSPSVSDTAWQGRAFPGGLFRSRCRIPANLLNDGGYRVTMLFVEDMRRVVFQAEDVVAFEVADSARGRGGWFGRWIGAVRPQLDWATELVETRGGEADSASVDRTW